MIKDKTKSKNNSDTEEVLLNVRTQRGFRSELKKYCVYTDRSIQDFVVEAIKEKIEREKAI